MASICSTSTVMIWGSCGLVLGFAHQLAKGLGELIFCHGLIPVESLWAHHTLPPAAAERQPHNVAHARLPLEP